MLRYIKTIPRFVVSDGDDSDGDYSNGELQ
jgi:hypothetical protein